MSFSVIERITRYIVHVTDPFCSQHLWRFGCLLYTMATITTMSLRTGKHLPVSRQAVLPQVERAEKKTFARHEAFDFHLELKKRNVDLVIVLKDDGFQPKENLVVVAYSIFVHSKPGNFVMLHKICVLDDFRRQGIATKILATQAAKYTSRGCSKIQLWVDEQNMPARSLYASAGFQEMNRVQNYYAPGRTGLQMALRLVPS